MGMSWFKRASTAGPALTRGEALDCVPLKNPRVRERPSESGDLQLTYPVTLKPWFTRLARRLGGGGVTEQFKKLQLDAMGSVVWELLDGQATVRKIVARFADRYQLHRREAEVAVTQFLRELGKRGLIALH